MKFVDITGHGAVKRLLTQQVDSGRLPHALLLWGPPGVGKLALARALAQYVHCPNRSGGDSCGVCPICRQHAALEYPDLLFSFPTPSARSGRSGVSEDFYPAWKEFLFTEPLAPWRRWLEISGADNSQPVIRVEESGEILRRLSMGNYGDSTKIFILWLPEKINPAAANKLLKIIEEPQPGRMFIMVSNNPSLILPTVYSRLQRVKVEVPSVQETASWLIAQGYDPSEASHAAAAAQGNQLLARQLLDPQDEQSEFRTLFQDVMRKAWQKDVASLRAWSDNVAGLKREKARRYLEYMNRQLRLNYLYNLHNDTITPMMPGDRQFSDRFSPFIHGGNVTEIMHEVDMASRDIAGNANARIVLFDLAVSLIMLIKKKP